MTCISHVCITQYVLPGKAKHGHFDLSSKQAACIVTEHPMLWQSMGRASPQPGVLLLTHATAAAVLQ